MTEAWIENNLIDVATLQRGFDLPHRARKSGANPIVTSSGVEHTHAEAKVHAPGVVTGRYGTIGDVFYLEKDFWPLNTTLYVKDFHGNAPLFVYYLLTTINFATHSGKSGVPGVNRNDLHQEKVVVPPTRAEQEAIAEALSDADTLIESLEQLIAKKRQIKQGAMQQLLTGRKRLPGFSGKWTPLQLGSHVTFLKTGTNSRADLSAEGAVAYLHYGDIHTCKNVRLNPGSIAMPHIEEQKVRRLDRLKTGDLVFVDASEDLEGVGKSVEVGNVPSGGLVAGLHTIAARFDKAELADGFKAYLQFCPQFTRTLRRFAAGTKVLATNRRHIKEAEVLLPAVSEQKAIASVLSDMDAEIIDLETRLAKARQVKQGMMQQLLTGRIRLVEPQPRPMPEADAAAI